MSAQDRLCLPQRWTQLCSDLMWLEKPPVKVKDEKKLFAVIKAAFAQRRKVISNSLGSGLSKSKDEIVSVLESAGIPLNSRAENLTMQNFADIANSI